MDKFYSKDCNDIKVNSQEMHNGDTLTIPATTMIRTINNQSGRPILSKNLNQRAVSLFTGQNVILDIL